MNNDRSTTPFVLQLGFRRLTHFASAALLATIQMAAQGLTGGNPGRIAELHWYPSNTKALIPMSAGIPNPGPNFMLFDGQSVWVTNYGYPCEGCGYTVSKFRPSDGEILGTYTVGTGPPESATTASTFLSVNTGSNTVSKLRGSDGARLATIHVGTAAICSGFRWHEHLDYEFRQQHGNENQSE